MWRVGCSSAVGSSHRLTGAPCQDSVFVESSDDGSWVAITVCDGAGSAMHAAEGAQYVSSNFNLKLLGLSQKLQARTPGGWVNDEIIRFVIEIRDGLRSLAKSDDISQYHTTLVSLLVGPFGGLSIHIGDGVVVAGEAKRDRSGKWETSKLGISEPENGEYANETFFVTESTWLKHLRITPLPRINWAILATDGGTEFIWDHVQKSPSATSLGHLFDAEARYLGRTGVGLARLDQAIDRYLTDEQYAHLTSDDKSLALVVRDDIELSAICLNLSPVVFTSPGSNQESEPESGIESEQSLAPTPRPRFSFTRYLYSNFGPWVRKGWRKHIIFLFVVLIGLLIALVMFQNGFGGKVVDLVR